MNYDDLLPVPGSCPFISRRVSIAWPPEPASEDSSVVVLTSRSYTTSSNSLPIALFLDLRLLLANGKVDWAFAGIRKQISVEPPRFRWIHYTDSRQDLEDITIVEDEGETVRDENGVDIEVGVGWNPKTSESDQPYEEIWKYVYARTLVLLKSDVSSETTI